MQFVYDKSGTAQQTGWVVQAIAECSYNLNLFNVTVNVKWVDPLPVSSDIGHAHSYMVTDSGGDNGADYTIYIATWADDASNPNNSGLPDPQNDILEFYKQSFVHEIGHVVSFETVMTQQNFMAQAASLYWTPDTSGGSGRRYGTLADFDATVWAQNMKEAIAETFKMVYYTGRLIYYNRTIWHLDPINWPELWKFLIPPVVANFSKKASSNGFDIQVPFQFGLDYIGGVTAVLVAGQGIQPNPIIPPALNPGGVWSGQLNVYSQAPDGSTTVVGSIGVQFICDNSFSSDPGGIRVQWSGSVGPGGSGGGGSFTAPNGVQEFTIQVAHTGGTSFQVTIDGPGGTVTGSTDLTIAGSKLLADFNGGAVVTPSNDISVPSEFFWDVVSAISPPPWQFGPASGDMGVGQGLRGAILIGQ